MSTAVFVAVPDGRTVHAGELDLTFNSAGVLLSSRFTYAAAYLADPASYDLCPEMPRGTRAVVSGPHRPLLGAFADSQPDTWGRRLIYAAEAREATEAGRSARTMTELDFLLSVPDSSRLGALRLSTDAGRTFVATSRTDLPTLVDLDALTSAAANVERHQANRSDLDLLLAAGTSMGGARPKATVRDETGELWMAKLPERDDRWDVLGWEYVTLQLANAAGINTPTAALRRLSADRSIMLTRRFDRTEAGRRIGYLSADSITEKGPHETIDYTWLAESIADHSDRPRRDLAELFRRVAFTLLVRNVDDHMKNHGVLRTAGGWTLSPLFDVNPHPVRQAIQSTPLTSSDSGVERDIRMLVDSADSYDLSTADARRIVGEVEHATSMWRSFAALADLDLEAVEFMAGAFEGPNREHARALADGGSAQPPHQRPRAGGRDEQGRFSPASSS